jgi:hypothetical protein
MLATYNFRKKSGNREAIMSETQESPADDAAQHKATAAPDHRLQDQVTRHMTFSAAHPEVDIKFHPRTGRWEATYPGGRKGAQKVLAIELKDLLDRLEENYR